MNEIKIEFQYKIIIIKNYNKKKYIKKNILF